MQRSPVERTWKLVCKFACPVGGVRGAIELARKELAPGAATRNRPSFTLKTTQSLSAHSQYEIYTHEIPILSNGLDCYCS